MRYLIVKNRGDKSAVQVARRVSRRLYRLTKPTADFGEVSKQMFDVLRMSATRAAILFKPKYLLKPHKDRIDSELDAISDDMGTATDAEKLTRRERLKQSLMEVRYLIPTDAVFKTEQWMIDNGFIEE